MWINIKHIIKKNINKEKPCHKLKYCPYGAIVELFSLDNLKISGKKMNCEIFGHHCPMFYSAEDLMEEKENARNV